MTPARRIFACEVVEGDVVSTIHGPQPVEAAVRMGGHVTFWFPRTKDGVHRLDVDATELVEIRDAVVAP